MQELGEALLALSLDELIRGAERPADINRVMGSAFRNWLRSLGYPMLSQSDFDVSDTPAFLDATDAVILNYAHSKLAIPLKKGRDFLFKGRERYVIGEARFLSTAGGSQRRDLEEAIEFLREVKHSIIVAVAILDGVVWFNKAYINMLSKLKDDEPALTALLFHEFLERFR